ncbi:VWA domain-containing protein [Hasllibacter sp. MH4015]|uniref:VWA domain-containing protein n=1 Tax=Hasllibacter sp. MH4015 TaxID=2854029 RepID=UPI001CD2DEC6|nr:VWA domain-containing protein [Hasllibacter sp. MH4015]
MRAFFLALFTILMLPLAALAQSTDRPNTILVLDGSGSMWGQIDGVNKIVIARNVIRDMLADMADDVSLGLTVYGHRERGSCGDIETIVEPAPFTQDRILDAVNSINPRGRTPMTDAVIAAAQSLRHTEEAATVILVSDGIENCNPDPCAIATELEQSGVAFTAHVIGFDVASEPEARAQMQCIADNTGGQFLTADNAAELSAALEQVVEAALPTPMRIEAQVMPQGTLPTRPVTWLLTGADGDVISSGIEAPAIDVQLFPGRYLVQATRVEPDGPQTYQTSFDVIQDRSDLIVVAMPPIIETSQVTFTARVEPEMSVPASPLNWTLSDDAGTVLLGPVAAPGGNVALLPGDYLLTVERVNQGTTHEARFTVEPNQPREVVIPLPAISVDVNFIARIGSVSGLPVTDPVIWEVTPLDPAPEIATTNPASVALSRGAYRVTAYWTAQEVEVSTDFVIVDQPREIVVVFDEPIPQASITTVAQARAGDTIEVAWTGPGGNSDWLGFFEPSNTGNHGHQAGSTVRINQGNPLQMRVAPIPGTYELRYIDAENGRRVLARVPFEVLPQPASVQTVTGVAGSQATVEWTGPNFEGDWLGFFPVDNTANHGHQSLSSVRLDGTTSPATLNYPAEAGTYELRYVMALGRTTLASQTVEVTEVQATLTTSPTGTAGAQAEVGWTGPAYDSDWIGFISPDNTSNHSYEFATRVAVASGNPVRLNYPAAPGTYELRYVQAQGRQVLARMTVVVGEVEASLTTSPTGTAGAQAEVGWTGPAYDNDWIGFINPDNTSNHSYDFATRVAVSSGNPVRLNYPAAAGTYELRYVQAQGRQVLARMTVVVGEVEASLTTSPTGIAGAQAEVGWTGPAYDNDWIGFINPDNTSNHSYDFATRVAVSSGNPVRLNYPAAPGTYELRYVQAQGRQVLARMTVVVGEVEASLTTSPTGTAGAQAEVGWTGPAYDNDWIGFINPENTSNHSYDFATRVAVSSGNPVRLNYPAAAGTYELRYVQAQGRQVLARMTVVVGEVEASLTTSPTGEVGQTAEIGWTGPAYDGDWIGFINPDDTSNHSYDFASRVAVNTGNPVQLAYPNAPGTYELRYIQAQGRQVLARMNVVVEEAEASLTVPQSVEAGSTIEVTWTGPNAPRDYIGIGPAGATGGGQWQNYSRTSDGNPLRLLMPPEPGEYVIQYFLNQGNRSLVSVPVTVTAVEAGLTAPSSAIAGETIEVGWTGPDQANDYIAIGRVGATGGGQWENYTRTNAGNPSSLLVPATPGDYVIQYFLNQGNTSLATFPLTVLPVEASVTAPASAVAGETIEVGWTGPDYVNDYIGIGLVGATGGGQWQAYSRTSSGNPVQLRVPVAPGTYEIRYFVNQDNTEVAITTIEVTEVQAIVTAPETAAAGSSIEVGWVGPDYDNDFIGIGPAGATGGGQWQSYQRTSQGNPVTLAVPSEPGSYLIQYFLNQGNTPIGSVPITVQ